MFFPSRLLLVDDTIAEWQLALAGFAESGFMEQAIVVKDKVEALDFLHARGAFKRRNGALPAVVVLGAGMNHVAKLSLLKDIRADKSMRSLPVVVVSAGGDTETARAAYQEGANSVVPRDADSTVQIGRYARLALFWAQANEPPPGSLSRHDAGVSRS